VTEGAQPAFLVALALFSQLLEKSSDIMDISKLFSLPQGWGCGSSIGRGLKGKHDSSSLPGKCMGEGRK
jgi:hypothetical protein